MQGYFDANNIPLSGGLLSGTLGNATVVSGNIASGAIGFPHLANASVNSGTLASGAAYGWTIASGTITARSGILLTFNADGTMTIGRNA